jgi:hypothetical protein
MIQLVQFEYVFYKWRKLWLIDLDSNGMFWGLTGVVLVI